MRACGEVINPLTLRLFVGHAMRSPDPFATVMAAGGGKAYRTITIGRTVSTQNVTCAPSDTRLGFAHEICKLLRMLRVTLA